MKDYNERTSATVTVRLFDSTGAPVVPTTLSYALNCLTTGKVVDSDELTPDSTVVIVLITAIENRSNSVERKSLVVYADADLTTTFSDDGEFNVRRLGPP